MANVQPPQEPPQEAHAEPPSGPPQPALLSQQTRELLNFIREENRANRDYFNFVTKIAVGGISVLLTLTALVVGFFGLRTIHEIEGQARVVTAEEISKMRREIRSRIDKEFDTPLIKATVREAAQQQTKGAAGPLIREEVTKQVAKTISSIAPIQELANASALALSAQGDDALAFDQLESMQKLPADDTRRKIADATIRGVKLERNSHSWRADPWNQPEKQTMDSMLRILKLRPFGDPRGRKSACDTLTLMNLNIVRRKPLMRELVSVALTDPSLDVRESAYRDINTLMYGAAAPVHTAAVLDSDALKSWWSKNESWFPD